MTNAICFSCGAEKFGALTQCGACKSTPRAEGDLALSLVLSDHLSSKTQLGVLAHEIRSHLKLTVPEALLRQAHEALKDPQLLLMLGTDPGKATDGSQARPTPRTAAPGSPSTTRSSSNRRQRVCINHSFSKIPLRCSALPLGMTGAGLLNRRRRSRWSWIMTHAKRRALTLPARG